MPTSKRDGVYTRSDRTGYWISYVDGSGKRRQRKTRAHSLQQARAILARELYRVEQARTLGYAPPGKETFADLTKRYLHHQNPRVSRAHYSRIERIIEIHLEPAFIGALQSIKRSDIQKFVTERAGIAAPATVAKELVTLRHMLSLAVEWELIQANPAQSVRPPKLPPGRVRYLQPAELRQLVEMASEWLRPIIAIAVLTGMRRSEILGLRWTDVDFSANRLILRQTKNNSVRFVYLNTSALAAFASLQPGAPADRIFSIHGGAVSKAFERLCAHIGIDDFRFHDLRHTAASWLRMSGADSHTVGQILGHRDQRMAARYQHLSPVFLADAVGKLDGVFGLLEEGKFAPVSDHSVTGNKQNENGKV